MRALSLKKAVFLSLSICLSSCSSALGLDAEVFAHGHEQLWIIDSIGRDVTQIALFAAKSDAKNKSKSLDRGSQSMMSRHSWSCIDCNGLKLPK